MSLTFRIVTQSYQDTDEGIVIDLVGLTKDNKEVYCKVVDFQSTCYLELPVNMKWTKSKAAILAEYIKFKLQAAPPDYFEYKILKLLKYSVKRPFLIIKFKTLASIKHLENSLKYEWKVKDFKNFEKNEFKLHEAKYCPLVKCCVENQYEMSGWVTVKPLKNLDKTIYPPNYSSKDYSVYTKKIKAAKDLTNDDLVNPKVLSFDIELHSTNRKSAFSDQTNPANVITMISVTAGYLNQDIDEWDTWVLTQYKGTKHQKHKATVIATDGSEKKLLLEFFKLVKSIQPHIITGYNINGFDWKCIIAKAKMHKIEKQLCKMGCLNIPDEIVEKKWGSNARGIQELIFMRIWGVYNFDMFPEIKFNYKFPTYRLDYVAKHFLKESKEDMPYKQMFALYDMIEVVERAAKSDVEIDAQGAIKLIQDQVTRDDLIIIKGTTNHVVNMLNDLKECTKFKHVLKVCRSYTQLMLDYVVQDAKICPKLMKQLSSVINLWESCNITSCPQPYMFEKGASIKVYYQLFKEKRDDGFVVPTFKAPKLTKEEEKEKAYQGAIVLKAVKGLYYNIGILDFKSLYPSIMIAHNVCYSTIRDSSNMISDDKCHIAKWQEHEYCKHDPNYKGKIPSGKKRVCKNHHYRFEKEPEGILPRMERKLLAARSKVKKEMAIYKKQWKELFDKEDKTEEEIEKMKWLDMKVKILDARQLAIKVSCNSCYGFMGARYMLPLIAGAASVTFWGRYYIKKTIELVENGFPGCKVIYGDTDSVFVQFPKDYSTEKVFEMSEIISQYVTDQLPEALILEAENIYSPLFLITPKLYEYCIIDNKGKVTKVASKGTVNTRRDNCDTVRKIYSRTYNEIIKEGCKYNDALYILNQEILGMFRRQFDDSQFVVYQALKKATKDYEKPPGHVSFAKRLEERNENTIPANTRLEFVLVEKEIQTKAKIGKIGDYMEDFSYFVYNKEIEKLKINYFAYITNKMNSVETILDIAFPKSKQPYIRPDEDFKRACHASLPSSWQIELGKERNLFKRAKLVVKHSDHPAVEDAVKNAALRLISKTILDKLYRKNKMAIRRLKIPKEEGVIFNNKILKEFAEIHFSYKQVVNQIKKR